VRHDVRAVLKRLGIEVTWEEGTRLWALCPFHLAVTGREDTKASWFIRSGGPRAGQSHCFSCQDGGTLTWLVQHVLGFRSSGSARSWLEGFEAVPEPLPEVVSVRVEAPARRAFALPPGVVDDEPLEEWPSQPRDYALSRGLTPAQVRRWGIGYAVEGRLEGRLVIPVHDARDELRNYMARTFTGQRRRYLYPSAADGAGQDALFGERCWPSLRRRVVACEGALNALSVERVCPGDAVAAIGGSNVRPIHAAKLATFAEVVLLTDPDEAGDAAAEKLRGMLGRHCRIARVRLPAGTDAASLPPDELTRCLAAHACPPAT
jgi:DNA primase